ncbi:Ras guanine nucleotide exchange factor [Entamoeba marina]
MQPSSRSPGRNVRIGNRPRISSLANSQIPSSSSSSQQNQPLFASTSFEQTSYSDMSSPHTEPIGFEEKVTSDQPKTTLSSQLSITTPEINNGPISQEMSEPPIQKTPHEIQIDATLKKLEKANIIQKSTFTDEQKKFIQQTLDKYPQETFVNCYKFSDPNEKGLEVNSLKEILYRLEEAINTVNKTVESPFILPYNKRQTIPSFVFDINNSYNPQMQTVVLKIQIRKTFIELYCLARSTQLCNTREKVKYFCEKTALLADSLQRRKEKIMTMKRDVSVQINLRTDAKGIETDENGNVVSGSIEALIRWAVNPNIEHNIQFVETLLITYREYLKPSDFFKKIETLYQENRSECHDKKQKETRHKAVLKIVLLLSKWMSSFPHDFMDSGEEGLLPMLEKFLDNNKNDVLLKKTELNKQMMIQTASEVMTIEEKLGILNVQQDYSISTLPTEQFAQQLTLYEYELFKSIEAKRNSPNLCALIDHFNSITNWVTSTIIDEFNCKTRAAIIKKFISIADELLRLNNYNGVFEFFSGLNSTPVGRLKMTWEEVGNFTKKLKALEKVTIPTGAYQAYRGEIKLHQSYPCIPFFGVYLQDLTFIHEGNEDYVENGDVNFVKCINPEILAFIRKINIRCLNMGEKELYDKSLVIEPRQQN